jgi:ribosomal protein S27E
LEMEELMRRTQASDVPAYAWRHGSLDKVPAARAEVFEIACPECDATLCFETSILSASLEIECAGCGGAIALAADGSVRPGLRFPRAVAGS